jgi:hypothetical protein
MIRYFLTACAIAFGFPAFAIAPCLPHDEMAKFLANQFREQQRFVGLDHGGNMLELWFSPGGTFTALITAPGGQTCVVSAGNAGNIIAAEKPGVDG